MQADEYIDERHRHRYEVNPNLVSDLEDRGLRFVGKDESGQRMEIVELKGHPYFVAGQFHPEFKSRPGKPSPLFLGLILASSGQSHHPALQSDPCITQQALFCSQGGCSGWNGRGHIKEEAEGRHGAISAWRRDYNTQVDTHLSR